MKHLHFIAINTLLFLNEVLAISLKNQAVLRFIKYFYLLVLTVEILSKILERAHVNALVCLVVHSRWFEILPCTFSCQVVRCLDWVTGGSYILSGTLPRCRSACVDSARWYFLLVYFEGQIIILLPECCVYTANVPLQRGGKAGPRPGRPLSSFTLLQKRENSSQRQCRSVLPFPPSFLPPFPFNGEKQVDAIFFKKRKTKDPERKQ